jgi:hypothetical protein
MFFVEDLFAVELMAAVVAEKVKKVILTEF